MKVVIMGHTLLSVAQSLGAADKTPEGLAAQSMLEDALAEVMSGNADTQQAKLKLAEGVA